MPNKSRAAGVRHELPIPPAAVADPGAVEVLRAWIANENLHVAFGNTFPDAGMWGMLLVDVARHAARAMDAEGICAEAEALEQIRDMFDAEWDRPTDVGTTQTLKKQ